MADGALIPSDLLCPSPSFRDGVEPAEELLHRAFGCELVQEAGILLRLPQVVMATAQNLLHRFFYRKSLLRFDVCTVAMGCLLLATKIEEKSKILREVIYVFHRMYQRRCGFRVCTLELGGEQYNSWKCGLAGHPSDLTMVERHILKELGFAFYSIGDHPHKYILYFIKVIEGDNALAQCAWNYLNDSLRLDLCLRHRAEVIACAAVYMAVQSMHFPLRDDVEWWVIACADLDELLTVGEAIAELYEMPKLTWLHPLCEDSLFSPEECLKFDSICGDRAEVIAAEAHSALQQTASCALSGHVPESVDCKNIFKKNSFDRSGDRSFSESDCDSEGSRNRRRSRSRDSGRRLRQDSRERDKYRDRGRYRRSRSRSSGKERLWRERHSEYSRRSVGEDRGKHR